VVPKDVHAVDVDHVTTILDNVSATLVFTGKKKKYTFFKFLFLILLFCYQKNREHTFSVIPKNLLRMEFICLS